jgi:hypothetical protein
MGTKKTLVGDLILFLVLYFPKDPNRSGSSQIFPKQGNRGFFDFQKISEDQNQRIFDLQKFPKDWNNRRFSRLVISQNFQKTRNHHRRVFDFPSLLDPGGL